MLSIIQRRISSNSLFRWLCANWVGKIKAMVVDDCLLTRHMWLKGKWVARRGKGELHGILQILWRRLHSPQGPMFAGLLGKTLVLTKISFNSSIFHFWGETSTNLPHWWWEQWILTPKKEVSPTDVTNECTPAVTDLAVQRNWCYYLFLLSSCLW